jgi:hypothetical protein
LARSALGTLVGRYPNLTDAVVFAHQRRDAVFAHTSARAKTKISWLIVPDLAPTPQDVSIARRLIDAYHFGKERSSSASGPGEIWTAISARQGRFFDILRKRNPEELAAYLCNMSRHDATTGIVQGNDEYDRISRDASYRRHLATMALDKLISLAEALGTVPPENPEQGKFGESFELDPDWLVDEISRRLEMNIAPPAIDGGLLKIRAGAGLFGERDLNAIYTAHLLVNQMPIDRTASVCEIGGGSGRVAYWSTRFGLRSYTLIDLPQVNVVQGYYLLRSLPDVDIRLHGEPHNDQTRIKILPNDALPTNWHVNLFVNQDSFPEMHPQVVSDFSCGFVPRPNIS